MIISEKKINEIVKETIQASINDIIKNQPKDVDNYSPPKFIGLNMPMNKSEKEKLQDRRKSYCDVKAIKKDNNMEKKVAEAVKNGLRFPKGICMKILSTGKKVNYSTSAIDFFSYMQRNYPNKKITKKLIPLKKMRNQLDDVEYYDLIINVL